MFPRYKNPYLHKHKNIRVTINPIISVYDYIITITNYIITSTNYKINDNNYRISRHLR